MDSWSSKDKALSLEDDDYQPFSLESLGSKSIGSSDAEPKSVEDVPSDHEFVNDDLLLQLSRQICRNDEDCELERMIDFVEWACGFVEFSEIPTLLEPTPIGPNGVEKLLLFDGQEVSSSSTQANQQLLQNQTLLQSSSQSSLVGQAQFLQGTGEIDSSIASSLLPSPHHAGEAFSLNRKCRRKLEIESQPNYAQHSLLLSTQSQNKRQHYTSAAVGDDQATTINAKTPSSNSLLPKIRKSDGHFGTSFSSPPHVYHDKVGNTSMLEIPYNTTSLSNAATGEEFRNLKMSSHGGGTILSPCGSQSMSIITDGAVQLGVPSSSSTNTNRCKEDDNKTNAVYDPWNDHYQDLLAFKKEYGHCVVPHNFPRNQKLAQWVKRQRHELKLKKMKRNKNSTKSTSTSLTDAHEKSLDHIGFVWDSQKADWLEKLESLREFKAIHGHFNVPSNYFRDRTLSIWVECQRRQYRIYIQGGRSTMNEDRVLSLNSIGFDWNL